MIFSGGAKSHIDDVMFNNGSINSYPYFEFDVERNVTTTVGQTAFLHCRVEQLGDKAVSLINKMHSIDCRNYPFYTYFRGY